MGAERETPENVADLSSSPFSPSAKMHSYRRSTRPSSFKTYVDIVEFEEVRGRAGEGEMREESEEATGLWHSLASSRKREIFFFTLSLSLFLGGFAYLFSLVLLLFGVGEGGSQAGFGGVLGSGKEFWGKKVKEVGSCTGKFFRKGMNISLK